MFSSQNMPKSKQ